MFDLRCPLHHPCMKFAVKFVHMLYLTWWWFSVRIVGFGFKLWASAWLRMCWTGLTSVSVLRCCHCLLDLFSYGLSLLIVCCWYIYGLLKSFVLLLLLWLDWARYNVDCLGWLYVDVSCMFGLIISCCSCTVWRLFGLDDGLLFGFRLLCLVGLCVGLVLNSFDGVWWAVIGTCSACMLVSCISLYF